MKVLLLGFGKIAYMPYMNFYLDTLCEKDVQFELIYWDRDGKPDAEVPQRISKAYKFEAHLEEQLPFKRKLRYFVKYRKFALNILNNNNYDKIIILHTTPGLTVLDYIVRKYRRRYLLDFRDVSYEYIPVYRKLVGILSKNSAVTFVSSNAFRKFLPSERNVFTIHNYLEDSLNHKMIRKHEERKRNTIRVSYWGLVRQVNVNKKIMDALGNDLRFELHYYGRMQQDGRDMEQYARRKGYNNVYFHGAYMPADRYEFAEHTDIIHNIYDCGYTTGNAIGNKYYDGIIFGIPQICTKGSYMGELVEKTGVGLTVELDSSNLADIIWNYYSSIIWDTFENACFNELESVVDQQKTTKQKLMDFLQQISEVRRLNGKLG